MSAPKHPPLPPLLVGAFGTRDDMSRAFVRKAGLLKKPGPWPISRELEAEISRALLSAIGKAEVPKCRFCFSKQPQKTFFLLRAGNLLRGLFCKTCLRDALARSGMQNREATVYVVTGDSTVVEAARKCVPEGLLVAKSIVIPMSRLV